MVEKKNSNIIEATGAADALSIKTGDYLLFRGTDGLPFNILEDTEEYLFDELSPTTKIKGSFLQCNNYPDIGNVIFAVDNDWMNSGMQFSHVLRDNSDNILFADSQRTEFSENSWLFYMETDMT